MRSHITHPTCDIANTSILVIEYLSRRGGFRGSSPLSLLRPPPGAPPVRARRGVPLVVVQFRPELHRVDCENNRVPVEGSVTRVEPLKLDVVRNAGHAHERFVCVMRADADFTQTQGTVAQALFNTRARPELGISFRRLLRIV